MRTLEFTAEGQSLKWRRSEKPKAGSKGGYLVAKFDADSEYDGADMVIASFGDASGGHESACLLGHDMTCAFPDAVTDYPVISVWLTCKTSSGAVFQTNRALVRQRR